MLSRGRSAGGVIGCRRQEPYSVNYSKTRHGGNEDLTFDNLKTVHHMTATRHTAWNHDKMTSLLPRGTCS